jgi:hypothetical protein
MLYGAGLATIIKVSPLPAGPRPQIVPALSASVHSAHGDSDPFTKAASSAAIPNSTENVP